MKRLFYFSVLLIPTIVGCNKSLETTQLREDTIKVSLIQPTEDINNTKTNLLGAGSNLLGWNTNDIIYVTTNTAISGTSYNTYQTTAANGSSVASFSKISGTLTYNTGDKFAIMYTAPIQVTDPANEHSAKYTTPYAGNTFMPGNDYLVGFIPFAQSYTENGITSGNMPMYGYTTSLDDISLTCLGSILRFNLYSESGYKLKTITVYGRKGSGDSDSDLAGIAGGTAVKKSNPGVEYNVLPVNPDNYFGAWSLLGKSGMGASKITYDCSSATLSNNSSNPTEFNIVFGVSMDKVGQRVTDLKVVFEIETSPGVTINKTKHIYATNVATGSFHNNRIYSLKTKNIDSF